MRYAAVMPPILTTRPDPRQRISGRWEPIEKQALTTTAAVLWLLPS